MKPLDAFTASMKKRISLYQKTTGLLCRECQCPPCLKCGKRADDADSMTCRIQDNYYCEDCRKDHKMKQCRKCGESKSLTCYPENVRRQVEKIGNIQHKHHLCTECVGKNELEKKGKKEQPLKECGKCHKKKSLECYPEDVRRQVEKRGRIEHNHHWCTECMESKEEHKVDWLSACIAEKTKKQCITCEKWKSIESYPEKVRASMAKTKKICNMRHSCSKCMEKNA